ncbi:PPE family protein [Mycobacterium interjectum]|uniref:PPE family protein n=1 Tax=Mycobacterium interjectum TaxID=33895 RepID=UPI000834D1D0|nr:PPE family protein [Mycobacterium interjectum]MCV7088638.1 PPE family protein [Mycobacterium interjectum]
MALDFGALPPEINSARLYAGVGSTPLVTAASAWNSLAAELTAAALDYENVVTQLASEEWLGPASASMAQAAQPYVEWVSTTAAQAEQAATQASAAAAAYEAAVAAIVPPPVIAANRAELAEAVQTNVIGQNTGIIAQLEAQYGEFWAQDAATMYSYAGNSASASTVTPFTAAPTVANPAASTTQAAAATTSVSSIQNQLNSAISQITAQLTSLASPYYTPLQQEWWYFASGAGPLSPVWQMLFGSPTFPGTSLSAFMSAISPYAGVFYNTEGLPYFSIGMANSMTQTAKTLGAIGGAAAPAAAAIPKGLPGLSGLLGGGAPVAAHLGSATSLGKLSVPASWSGPVTAPSHATAIPVSNVREAPDAGAGNLLGGMPLAGTGTGGSNAGPRYGFKPVVMARPPAAG